MINVSSVGIHLNLEGTLDSYSKHSSTTAVADPGGVPPARAPP